MRWGHQLVAHRLAFQGLKLLQWTGIQQRIFARAPYSRGSPTGSGGNEVAANTAGARSTPALILVMILRLSLRHKTKESQDKSPQEEQPFLQEQRNIAVQQEGAPLAGGRGSLAPLGHCLLLQDGQPRPPALCPFSGQPATGPHPGHALLEGPPSRDSCQSLGGSRSIRGGWAWAGCAGAGHAREGNRAVQGWAGAEGETPRRLQVTWPQPGPPLQDSTRNHDCLCLEPASLQGPRFRKRQLSALSRPTLWQKATAMSPPARDSGARNCSSVRSLRRGDVELPGQDAEAGSPGGGAAV